ncbi:MAG TPA: hypothetical protein VGM84_09705 [Steroidobacteraceae bacterium]|jgi:hypothetical protein
MATLTISESRRLVIPLETAVDAVLQLDWEHGGRLADLTLTEVRVEAGDPPALLLSVQRPDVPSPEIRKFSLPAVAAAIISLCRKNKIPLPHSWPKKLEIVPEGFALSLEGTVQFLRHHGPLPARPRPKEEPQATEQPQLAAAG